MTGGSAIYGEGAQNAIDLAVEEINSSGGKYTVEILNGGKVVDDAKDAKQAVNAYNSLLPENPEAIVGSFFSSVTLPMAELAKESGMLLLATGATNYAVTIDKPTVFRNCFIDPYQGKMAALFAKDQGATKAAIIYAKDDDYSNGLKDAFVENAQSNGIEIVYTGECTTTDTDFTAQASQAAALSVDASAAVSVEAPVSAEAEALVSEAEPQPESSAAIIAVLSKRLNSFFFIISSSSFQKSM